MPPETISSAFYSNVRGWKIFALWIREVNNKYYKCYAALSLVFLYFLYDGLLTLNLIYSPKNLNTFIPELVFLLTSFVLVFKINMVMFKSKLILRAFSIMDSDIFSGETLEQKRITKRYVELYKKYYRAYFVLGYMSYTFFTIVPFLKHVFFGQELILAICNYYFLSDKERDANIYLYWCYQSLGNFAHMNYGVNIDTFIPGLIMIGIGQFKALNVRLSNIKTYSKKNLVDIEQEKKLEEELIKCLKHYDLLREYCSLIEEIFDTAMFVQFGVGAAINCVTLVAMLQLPSNEMFFLILYGVIMAIEIFTPGYLGTQLEHESERTTSAVYECDWMDRSPRFKRNMMLLVERANTSVELTALTMFPLSLETFVSIMKGAYSCFTLVRAMNGREDTK
ncbi:unnamed protein product [Plutella xylostella]|uniref:Odorant receptor n=1 Tax=Plutella xylostella TaxID=51655 RepID=A0A8G1GM41_PLUXY|nr:odorant receptor 40 [Plutella xylostella]CAG9132303.1 unnamed protein product [Plutella xylostella]